MTTWLSGVSRQQRTIRRNVVMWCGIYAAIFLTIIGRLCWLQVVNGGFYRAVADEYHLRNTIIPSIRGSILDCNHRVLALDDRRLSLFVDPTMTGTATQRRFTAARLAPVIGRSEAEVLEVLGKQLPFVWVVRDLSAPQVEAVSRLTLPSIKVQPDGKRYRIGVDLEKIPASAAVLAELADALQMTRQALTAQVGDLAVEPADENGNVPRRTGTRWISGTVNERVKAKVKALHLTGILIQEAGLNYSLGADPRLYTTEHPAVTADQAAALLASALGVPARPLAARLRSRPHFAWVKRGISEEMYRQIMRLQGTLFVVEPGKVPLQSTERDVEDLPKVIERLYILLNGKKGPEVISKDAIQEKLVPGAAPGAMLAKLANGKPSVGVSRSLNARRIPGVVYGLPGVAIQQERRRRYPYGPLASASLGFVMYGENDRPIGAFGLEAHEEETLGGVDGREEKEIDARHIPIPEHTKQWQPTHGRDIVLTLNLDIQQAAEEELAKAVQGRALAGQCVVLDPTNGEILALATYPRWDANAPGNSEVPLVNMAINNYYEPGSTFKVVPVLAALEEGIARDGHKILHCSGSLPIGNRSIGEAHNAHGDVDPRRLLEQSCNLGAATLAMRLGPAPFLAWCEKLGFGQRTGVEIANESPGSLNRKNATARITLANMGFGQSITVTPLQLAAAYAVIANKGEWVQPHFVKGRVRKDGTVEYTPPATRRRVCSEATAALMLDYLENVVVKGTGKTAAISGYRVGGKTGTAQKPVPGLGYRGGKHIASFAGVMPVNDPKLCILTVIDEPKGPIWGGVAAAPVVREVGHRALRYLKVPPSAHAPERAPSE